jgi:hypothetical protein
VFCSATVWAGVVAAQRPITCPNRQLQPERYMPFCLEIYFKKDLKNVLTDVLKYCII